MRLNDLHDLYDGSVSRFQKMRKQLLTNDHEGYSTINRYITLAWLGIIGYPMYYWMWAYVFPQLHESLILRLIGLLLAMPLLLARRLHRMKWFNAYFYFAFTYAFPFFFTYMFLMNRGASVWAQSVLVALFLVLYLDFTIALASVLFGVAFACLGFYLATGGHDWPTAEIMSNLPVLMFAVVAISIMKIGRGILADEKLHGMASALGVISHELRTPLRSVDASARGLKRYLPVLTEFYDANHPAHALDHLPMARLEMMEASLDRIQADVRYMNSAIDLLLANAWQAEGKTPDVQTIDLQALVINAINAYPFENESQRSRVRFECRSNFEFIGNENLATMILFNLLKNALRAIARAGKGEIDIVSVISAGENIVVFKDTGCGIPSQALANIFHRFYSYPSNASTGIGLAFCRDTLATWGAKISCVSEFGSYTEFVIQFRPIEKSLKIK